MRDIWDRIENWLMVNAPDVLLTLQPGATYEQIRKTEEYLFVNFPEDIKASYLIHNGQFANKHRLLFGREFLSLDSIEFQWGVWKDLLDDGVFVESKTEPDNEINSSWWDARWIPLTYDGSGNHHCLDLNPSSQGNIGQIISMWHDDAKRELVASSFREWLEKFADGLYSGKLVYSDEYSGIIDIDEI